MNGTHFENAMNGTHFENDDVPPLLKDGSVERIHSGRHLCVHHRRPQHGDQGRERHGRRFLQGTQL